MFSTNIKNKIKLSLFFFTLTVVSFFIARIALYFYCHDYFSTLIKSEVFLSFLNGFRFDFSSISIFVLSLTVFMFIPVTPKIKHHIYIITFLLSLISMTMILILAGDVIFFNIFNKHLETELLSVQTHASYILQEAFQHYFYITIPAILMVISAIYFIFKYIKINFNNTEEYNKKYIIHNLIVFFIIGLLIFIFIRGKFNLSGKPLGIMDAQLLGSQKTSELILNGIFTSCEGLRRIQHRDTFFDKEECFKLANITSSEELIDPEYPFYRRKKDFSHGGGNGAKYNFVIIFLESWDKEFYDKYPEAMPNLIKIKNESLNFVNFYNSGSRSLTATTSTLFSIPYVWGLPFITNGLGAKNMSRLANYFKEKNYSSYYVLTDNAQADKADEIARYLGFEHFYAKSDIPVKHKYPIYTKGFDYEGFEFFFNKINESKNNFLGFFYTSSTHGPWDILLLQDLQKYPQTSRDFNFLNRLVYSDYALGNFFDLAKKQPWFENTIFFILPDHHVPFSNRKYDESLNDAEKFYSSFLLIYCPKLFKPQTIETYSVQEDIVPTILDLLNSSTPYSSASNSLFDKERRKEAFIYAENKKIYIVGDSIYEELDVSNPNNVKELIKENKLSKLQKEALAFNEAVYYALKENKWQKK